MSFSPISQCAGEAETQRDETIHSSLVGQQVSEFAGPPPQNTTDGVARTKDIYLLPVWKLEVCEQGSGRSCFWQELSP